MYQVEKKFFAGIKTPHSMRKRGHLKGHLLTTIGMPRKRNALSNKPCRFNFIHLKKSIGTVAITIP